VANSKVTLKFNQSTFQKIRTAPKAMAMLNDIANETALRAGEGFVAKPADVTGGRVRGRAAVVATTRKASASEARNHTLLKALGGGTNG